MLFFDRKLLENLRKVISLKEFFEGSSLKLGFNFLQGIGSAERRKQRRWRKREKEKLIQFQLLLSRSFFMAYLTGHRFFPRRQTLSELLLAASSLSLSSFLFFFFAYFSRGFSEAKIKELFLNASVEKSLV